MCERGRQGDVLPPNGTKYSMKRTGERKRAQVPEFDDLNMV